MRFFIAADLPDDARQAVLVEQQRIASALCDAAALKWITPDHAHLTLVFLGDVDDARVGDRWRVGDGVLLEVTGPRVPCATFRSRMGVRGWLRTFSDVGRTGAYLAVVQPGVVNDHLRAACAEQGLWYPPDPASSPW